MIQNKSNPNAPSSGLQLGDQESGCCGTAADACKYKFVFATTPTTFSTITIAGVAYDFVHTYSTPLALHAALLAVLTSPLSAGGAGLVVEENDLLVYLDPFSATANRLTIEMISGIVITNFITNVGTQTATTTHCTKQTMCLHQLSYTLSAAITLSINNVALTLATYATAALLRTALEAQIIAQSLTEIASVKVRTSATAGTADVWLYVKPGIDVYHNGTLVSRGACKADFVTLA